MSAIIRPWVALRARLRKPRNLWVRWVWLLTALLLACLVIGTWFKIKVEREAEIDSIQRNNLNLARLFEEHTSRTLKGIDQTVRFLQYEYERFGKSISISDYVQQGIIQTGVLNQLGVIDENGIYILSDIPGTTGINLADREHFKVHILRDSHQLFISKPILGRASHKWSLNLTRRINKKDGSFGGVVAVSLNPEYLMQFYRTINVGQHGLVSLFGADGIVRARRQGDDLSFGQDISKSKVAQMAFAQEMGTTELTSQFDGAHRFLAFSKVTDYPLWAVVGVSADEALADFNGRVRLYWAYTGIVCALAIVLAWSVSRFLQRQWLLVHDLEHSQREAQAANVAKSRFLANMSHEIRTPLNGVLGMAQLLRQSELSEPQRLEYAEIICTSGEALLTILNDILDLSKIEAGKLDLNQERFNPAQLIAASAALYQERAQSKGLQLYARWNGPSHNEYMGDPIRLQQILNNLLSNAIKFTSFGSVSVDACEARDAQQRTVLQFSVTDTGVGIAAEKQALLFQAFSQVDDSSTRAASGAGLGLSIVRQLAQLMGGSVYLRSEPGKGTECVVRIPVKTIAATPVAEPKLEPKPTHPATNLGPARAGWILAVEDVPANTAVLRGFMRQSGVNCRFAENGQQALDMLQSGDMPDLILMDCQMPVLDGFEATKHIRQMEKRRGLLRTPIIALTASVFGEDKQRCFASGMDDFLSKPVQLDDMHATLRKWLPGFGS